MQILSAGNWALVMQWLLLQGTIFPSQQQTFGKWTSTAQGVSGSSLTVMHHPHNPISTAFTMKMLVLSALGKVCRIVATSCVIFHCIVHKYYAHGRTTYQTNCILFLMHK